MDLDPGHSHDEPNGNKREEPSVIKKSALNERLADEMRENGIECEALKIGSMQIENEPYYSHTFAMDPNVVTNKGLIRVKGRNIHLVQVIQRH